PPPTAAKPPAIVAPAAISPAAMMSGIAIGISVLPAERQRRQHVVIHVALGPRLREPESCEESARRLVLRVGACRQVAHAFEHRAQELTCTRALNRALMLVRCNSEVNLCAAGDSHADDLAAALHLVHG